MCSHNIYMGDMVKAAAEELAPTIHDLRRKGYSYREIAQTLGVSTKLVCNVLHSAPDTGQDAEGNTKTDPGPNINPHPTPPPTPFQIRFSRFHLGWIKKTIKCMRKQLRTR